MIASQAMMTINYVDPETGEEQCVLFVSRTTFSVNVEVLDKLTGTAGELPGHTMNASISDHSNGKLVITISEG